MVANPTWADDTLYRGMKILSAIFKSAILEYELSMANPWTGLTGKLNKNRDELTSEDRGNKRRSMTPDEIKSYKGHLPNINLQASLVGQLMIQTGCRRYGRDGGSNPLSEILCRIINLRMGLKADKTCVPYSTRHSMKDKLRALRTPMEIQYAILGNGKRTVAEGYGEGNPLVYLQQEIIKAEKLESWGK